MVSRGKNAPKHSSLDNFFSTNRPFGGYSSSVGTMVA